jgi:hypothetical protein
LFTFSLSLKPVSEEIGWNRGRISVANEAATLTIAIGALLVEVCDQRDCGIS